jgi:hypothetical protein
MYTSESLKDRYEATMLGLRGLEVDNVVVEVVFPRTRRHREELRPRRVDQYGAEEAYLRGNVNRHSQSKLAGRVSCNRM